MEDSIYSKDDIIRKVRGLIKLSQKASTSAQATAAAAKVTTLIAQYNLQWNEIHETKAVDFVKEEFQTDSSASWQRKLLNAICNSQFCKLITYTQTKQSPHTKKIVTVGSKNHVLIGEPHNIQFVKLLYEYLESILRRLASTNYDIYQQEDLKLRKKNIEEIEGKYRKRWMDSFFHGACTTLSERLARFRLEFEEGMSEVPKNLKQLPEPKVDMLKEALINFKPELEVEHLLQQLRACRPDEYEIDSLTNIVSDPHTPIAEIDDLLTLLLTKPALANDKTTEVRAKENHALVANKEIALNAAVSGFFPNLVSLEALDRSGREGFAEGTRVGRDIPLQILHHQTDQQLLPG